VMDLVQKKSIRNDICFWDRYYNLNLYFLRVMLNQTIIRLEKVD